MISIFFEIHEDGIYPIPFSEIENTQPQSKLSEAKTLILEKFKVSGQSVPAREMEEYLKNKGVSESTFKRAKKSLQIVSEKGREEWFWKLSKLNS